MSDTGAGDPTALSLTDLRAERSALQDADDVVSYVRRAAQARLDLARAEAARRVLASNMHHFCLLRQHSLLLFNGERFLYLCFLVTCCKRVCRRAVRSPREERGA